MSENAPRAFLKKRYRLAVVATANRSWGGSYQYSRQILRSLSHPDTPYAVKVLGAASSPAPSPAAVQDPVPFSGLTAPGTRIGALWERLPPFVPTALHRLRLRIPPQLLSPLRRKFHQWVRENRIDLVLFCEPNPMGFEAGVPYVMPIHDLLQRVFPEFSETRADGAWESREYCFRNAVGTARQIFVDSETSKRDLAAIYGASGDRITVLPFVPSFRNEDIRPSDLQAVRAKYRLPDRYFFYPAQFWKHKNHVRLVRALRAVAADHPEVRLILCGSKQNGYEEFRRELSRTGMEGHVRDLGYVPDEDLVPLFAGATALVMPTFNGPINIPILEAFSLGVPVLTSHLRGIREHVGNAALAVDPRDERAIADGMKTLWTNEPLRRSLARRGRDRLVQNTEEHFTRTLLEALERALKGR